MATTSEDFRRIALGMPDATEGAHMGHPDFRIGGRIFATLQKGMRTGMVVLTPEQQRDFVDEHAAVFMPESGAWGRSGCTRVRLDAADDEILGEAITLAFRHVSAKSAAAKKTPARRATGVTLESVLATGRALPGVEQSTTYGAPSLKLRGTLLACPAINKAAEPNSLMVVVGFPQRDDLIAADPKTYYLKDHYEPGPVVLVRLSRVRPDAMRDLLRMGWDHVNATARPKRAAKRTVTRKRAR